MPIHLDSDSSQKLWKRSKVSKDNINPKLCAFPKLGDFTIYIGVSVFHHMKGGRGGGRGDREKES